MENLNTTIASLRMENHQLNTLITNMMSQDERYDIMRWMQRKINRQRVMLDHLQKKGKGHTAKERNEQRISAA